MIQWLYMYIDYAYTSPSVKGPRHSQYVKVSMMPSSIRIESGM